MKGLQVSSFSGRLTLSEKVESVMHVHVRHFATNSIDSCQQKIKRARRAYLILPDMITKESACGRRAAVGFFRLILNFREEGRVKCHLLDMKSDKIVLSNLMLTKTNVCFNILE